MFSSPSSTTFYTLSRKTPPLTFVYLLEVACVVAIVVLSNIWLEHWELPFKTYIVHVHIVMLLAGHLLQPLDVLSLGLVFVVDGLAMVLQAGLYMHRFEDKSLDKHTSDEPKEYAKLGLIGGLTLVTFLRMLGAGDHMVPGAGLEGYRVSSNSNAHHPWKSAAAMPNPTIPPPPPSQYTWAQPPPPMQAIAVSAPVPQATYAYAQTPTALVQQQIPVYYPR
jgi:hypothetical protein